MIEFVNIYTYIYARMERLLLCCSRFEALIYQRTAKYKTDYIDSMFASFERGTFLSERILECMFWQRILSRLWSSEALYWLAMGRQVGARLACKEGTPLLLYGASISPAP